MIAKGGAEPDLEGRQALLAAVLTVVEYDTVDGRVCQRHRRGQLQRQPRIRARRRVAHVVQHSIYAVVRNMHLMSRALLRANRLYLRQPAPILTVACNGRIERIERRRGRWRQRRRRTRREGNGRWLNDQKARRDAERARNRVGDVGSTKGTTHRGRRGGGGAGRHKRDGRLCCGDHRSRHVDGRAEDITQRSGKVGRERRD